MDVLKLQKAYGCDGSCGGWAKSETGGLSSHIDSHKGYPPPPNPHFFEHCSKGGGVKPMFKKYVANFV